MAIKTPEKPGSFRKMQSLLHPRNITEFSYRHDGSEQAMTIVSFQALPGHTLDEDRKTVTTLLESHGLGVLDLSQNELAKAHVRHMAGGRSPKLLEIINHTEKSIYNTNTPKQGIEQELVYRFEFPEAAGALDRFLSTLGKMRVSIHL
jgi:threonine dehydratase